MRKASSQGAMFAKIVADRAGISSADMDCIDFVNVEGRMTAGRLAELTGLTTGAITGVVDRLEKAASPGRGAATADGPRVSTSPVRKTRTRLARRTDLRRPPMPNRGGANLAVR